MIGPAGVPVERRRVLVVLTAAQAGEARRDAGMDDLLRHPEVLLVLAGEDAGPAAPGAAPADPILADLRAANLLRPGAVLVQSPFDPGQYEEVGSAVAEFAVRKFTYVSRLCQLLGARCVTVEEVRGARRDVQWSGSGAGDGAVTSGSVRAERDLESLIRARLQMVDEFPGGAPQVEAAWDLLLRHGLRHDAGLSSLVELRSGENPVARRQMTIDLTEDCADNARLAARMSGMRLARADTELTRRLAEQTTVTLSLTVTF